jgi:hypothetical protein
MKVYIDENFPVKLAHGLQVLQEPLNKGEKSPIEVLSIKEVFGEGVADEDWIPLAGAEHAVVITQDYNIQRTRHQAALFREHGLGIFFYRPPSNKGFSYWEMVLQIVTRWEEIKKLSYKTQAPFAFRCSVRSKNFEPM